MTTALIPNPLVDYTQKFCTAIFSATLAAATDTSIAVPLNGALGLAPATTYNKFLMVVSCTQTTTALDDVFIALNQTAAVPVGAGFAATGSERINNGTITKLVKATDVVHFISGGTPNITVAFYAIQG